MSIQYAGGTNVFTTIAAGDRTTLVDNLKAQLVNAGWSVASGSSGDWKLDSATTPRGHDVRLRVWDPGSGNCAELRIMNKAETLAPAQSTFLLPGSGKTYYVIANKYQFFVYTAYPSAAREVAICTVPCVPDFVSTANCAMLMGNATSDTDTSIDGTFRTARRCEGTQAVIINSTSWTAVGGQVGSPSLYYVSPDYGSNTYGMYIGEVHLLHDAIVGVGQTNAGSKNYMVGQLWDAFLVTATYTSDAFVTYGSKRFAVFMINVSSAPLTLCVYAPES